MRLLFLRVSFTPQCAFRSYFFSQIFHPVRVQVILPAPLVLKLQFTNYQLQILISPISVISVKVLVAALLRRGLCITIYEILLVLQRFSSFLTVLLSFVFPLWPLWLLWCWFLVAAVLHCG